MLNPKYKSKYHGKSKIYIKMSNKIKIFKDYFLNYWFKLKCLNV